jgi:hypothetical protein
LQTRRQITNCLFGSSIDAPSTQPSRKVGNKSSNNTAAALHIAKFAAEIAETAENDYHIRPTLVDLKSWSDAQNAPTPYAIFALIYNGRLLADHQISNTRFRNIMNKCVTNGLISTGEH